MSGVRKAALIMIICFLLSSTVLIAVGVALALPPSR